jgi:hypothetical protein
LTDLITAKSPTQCTTEGGALADLITATPPTRNNTTSTGLQRAAVAISAGDEAGCLAELLSVLERADHEYASLGGVGRAELDVAAACCAELASRLGLNPKTP